MKNIAVLPIRSDSKRLKRKNFQSIAGIPLFSITVAHLINSGIFDKIIIATDEPNRVKMYIKEDNNIHIYLRKPENSQDYSTSEEIMKEVIMNFNINDKSWITLLQATNPFHKQEYFNQLNSLIDADKHDSIFTTSDSLRFPLSEVTKPSFTRERTQDREPVVYETGLFWSIKTSVFKATKKRIGLKYTSIALDRYDDFDIDDLKDWTFIKPILVREIFSNHNLIKVLYKFMPMKVIYGRILYFFQKKFHA